MILSGCSSGSDRAVRPSGSVPPTATTATSRPSDEPSPSPAPASTTGVTTAPTPTPSAPSPTPTRTRPPAVPIPGLPEQGVAIEHDGTVDLHDFFTGKLVASLPGYSIFGAGRPPSHLVLNRSGTYFLLDEFRRELRPLPSERAAERITGHEPNDPLGLPLPKPKFHGKPLLGFWRWAVPDPRYEDRLLAQWSGECEVPLAFFVEPDEGDVEAVTGGGLRDAPESEALGWTKRGQAVVFLPEGACGSGTDPPGVYLFRTAGQGRLLVEAPSTAAVRMWGAAIAD